MLAFLGFLIVVAIIPGIPSYAIAPREVLIVIGPALILCLNWKKRMTWTLPCVIGSLFMFYVLASDLWAPIQTEAWKGIGEFAGFFCAFIVGVQIGNLRPFLTAVGLGGAVNAIAVILQWYGHDPSFVEQVVPPGGLFANRDMAGWTCAVCAIAALSAARSWRWLILTGPLGILNLVGLAIADTRAGMFGVACAMLLWLMRRSLVLAMGLVALIAIVAAFGAYSHWPLFSVESLGYSGRAGMWLDALGDLRWFGHGVGQYWVTQAQHAPYGQAENIRYWHVHNDFLEAVFNYGLGAALYFALIGLCLLAPFSAEVYVFVCFLGVGMFGFPLYAPVTGLVGAVVAGRLAGSWPALRASLPARPIHRLAGLAGFAAQPRQPGTVARGRLGIPLGSLSEGPAGPRRHPVPRPSAEIDHPAGAG